MTEAPAPETLVPSPRPGLFERLRLAWAWVRRQEPARLQATVKALFGVAILCGISVPAGLDGRVTAVIGAVYGALALWQGEATRRKVVPLGNLPEGTVTADGQVLTGPETAPADTPR